MKGQRRENSPYMVEGMHHETGLARLDVQSSHALHERGRERYVEQQLRRGFDHRVFTPTPLSWSVDVNLKRTGRRGQSVYQWYLFELEDLVVEEDTKRLVFQVAMNVPRIMKDKALQLYGVTVHEGHIAEMIGFYAKMVAFHHEVTRGERGDMLFMGKRLSQVHFGGKSDELAVDVVSHYFFDVIAKREQA